MPLTVNGKEIGTVTRNGSALDKVTVNTSNVVWENWKYKTGNLVKMTSNSAPSPFTASKKGWPSDGGIAYNAFDGDLGTYMNSNNPQADGDITSTLMFGQEIRIAEITAWIGHGGPVFDNYDEPEEGVAGGWGAGNKNFLKLYGIKADGTEILLATHTSDKWHDASASKAVHTISAANQAIPFVGLTCHRAVNSGQGWYRLFDIQITKWWQKGS